MCSNTYSWENIGCWWLFFFNQLLIFHKTNCTTGKCNCIWNTECKWVLLLGKCFSKFWSQPCASMDLSWKTRIQFFPSWYAVGWSKFEVLSRLHCLLWCSLSVQSSNSFYLTFFHGFYWGTFRKCTRTFTLQCTSEYIRGCRIQCLYFFLYYLTYV